MSRAEPLASCEKNAQGYACDHARVCVGTGEKDFAAAKQALRSWECVTVRCFSLVVLTVGAATSSWAGPGSVLRRQWRWAPTVREEQATPLSTGLVSPSSVSVVCVCAKTLLLWSRNPLQVVFTEEAVRSPVVRKRFAFAHGTLCGHLLVRSRISLSSAAAYAAPRLARNGLRSSWTKTARSGTTSGRCRSRAAFLRASRIRSHARSRSALLATPWPPLPLPCRRAGRGAELAMAVRPCGAAAAAACLRPSNKDNNN